LFELEKKLVLRVDFARLDLPREEALNLGTVPKRKPRRGPEGGARPPAAAGPSIPTEGASNPTHTIVALSLRGAEHLADKWSTVAG
jgi:hypothetical protein